MTCRDPLRRMHSPARICALVLAVTCGRATARAQISFSVAIDMAVKNSPRIKMAEADVARTRASLDESRDVYIPSVTGSSSGLGDSYGFPLGTPTIFSLTAQSLVFSYSQKDYIRSATSGLAASNLALQDTREQVAEDAAVTYLALDSAQRQQAALVEEADYATQLETIVKERLEAGRDTAMELTRARRTGVQIRLQLLHLDDEIAARADHLSRLIGLPGMKLRSVAGSIPKVETTPPAATLPDLPGVRAAFESARSKREQAFGDARYTLRPQVFFGLQYSRFSTYNNNYAIYYPGIQNQPNAIGVALDITLPFLDIGRRAKARGSMAEADHLEHEALFDRDQAGEARLKLEHSLAELADRAELASLDRDLAQEQLDIVLVQLQGSPGGTPVTPKDEQNARIQERQRYIEMLDADAQMLQARVHLLRLTGQLAPWLKQVSAGLQAIPSRP